MIAMRRTTIYLNSKLYRALKSKAAFSKRAQSDLVNEALLLFLREDALDSEAIRKRAKEPSRPVAAVLRNLKALKSSR
jgi:hypothetical protein